MPISSLIPWTATLLLLIWLGTKGKIGYTLSNIILLILFLFARVVIDEKIGGFYSLMALGVLIFNIIGYSLEQRTGFNLFGSRLTGPAGFFGILVVGTLLTFVIRNLAGPGNAASVIGVPQSLAVSPGIENWFAPTLISSLGYLENRFFYGLILVFNSLIALTPVVFLVQSIFGLMPLIFASLAFSVFHLAVFAISGMFFALLAFILMSLVAVSPLGGEPGNVAHYQHNGIESLPNTLAVVA